MRLGFDLAEQRHEPYADVPAWRLRMSRLRHAAAGAPGDYARERLLERLARHEERRLLAAARAARALDVRPAGDQPLVTIRIATYNRGQDIVERALASALHQTYPHVEVLVVGDACDLATQQAVESVGDSRVRFVNLARRGLYPEERRHRWMVAGAAPMNAALDLARGDWIAPCDDDDELSPDHVEVLLDHAVRSGVEFVYSRALMQSESGTWEVTQPPPVREGQVSHGTVLYSLDLRFLRYSMTCWKLGEPTDWNLWRRMQQLGVRTGFVDRITYRHYA